MILHVDMDAFYASVEERECPSLVGQPVVVGGTAAGRGVVAAANYEARKYGVHSAMPSAVARRLCPQAVVITPRISFYSEISRDIRDIFERYTPLIEPLSLDEAFLDVAASETLFGTAPEIARTIKNDIIKELKLVASVGVAANKFIAKLASDLDKPDGLVVVAPGTEQAFLDPLPVGCVWGIGKASGEIFRGLGIHTIGDLREYPMEGLQSRFGRHGEHLWRLARGIDDRSVIPDHEAKSISHETTFERDIEDESVLRSWMLELTEQVGRRLRRHRFAGPYGANQSSLQRLSHHHPGAQSQTSHGYHQRAMGRRIRVAAYQPRARGATRKTGGHGGQWARRFRSGSGRSL